jgi:hypothetical protein
MDIEKYLEDKQSDLEKARARITTSHPKTLRSKMTIQPS